LFCRERKEKEEKEEEPQTFADEFVKKKRVCEDEAYEDGDGKGDRGDGYQTLLQMCLFAVGHAGEANGRQRFYCFVVGGE
jgi:hypothetical protein